MTRYSARGPDTQFRLVTALQLCVIARNFVARVRAEYIWEQADLHYAATRQVNLLKPSGNFTYDQV
jgi:hypothetical protein